MRGASPWTHPSLRRASFRNWWAALSQGMLTVPGHWLCPFQPEGWLKELLRCSCLPLVVLNPSRYQANYRFVLAKFRLVRDVQE